MVFFISLEGVAKAQEEPRIKILLQDSKNLSFRADSNKPIFVKGINKRAGGKKVKSLKVQIVNGEIRLFVNGYLQQTSKISSKLDLRLSTKDTRGIWFGGRRYSGNLKVKVKNNRLRLINDLTIEKYLASVVGAEMPKDWPIEALKAQSVASRTYALNQIKVSKSDFDVRATEKNQVYLGIESETNKIKRAVNRTRSLVLVYRGSLADAVFHSSSGGRTEDSSLVWGKKIDYLSSVRDFDTSSPHKNWSLEFSPSRLKEAFPEAGGLNAIRVINRSKSNRVLKALIYGSKGKYFYSGQNIRERLGLKSTIFNVQFINKKPYKNNTSKSSQLNLNKFDDSGYPIPPSVTGEMHPPDLPEINKDYLVLFEGSGSGHGVGMSQWGAYQMAQNGSSFQRILRHYYKGVKVTPFLKRYMR